jgi:hypothetical protein
MAETMPTETGIPFWIAWRLALRLPAGHCLCDRGPRTESQRQFRGSTQGPHRRVLESERMNHEQRSIPHPPIRDWSTMNSPTTSASARQRARNKGLAWVSAITLGAGAASALGAAAIAITLPSPTAATGTVATGSTATGTTATGTTGSTLAASAPVNTNEENISEDDSGTTRQAAALQAAPQQAVPLQATAAPTTTNIPPVATTAAS